MNERSSEKHTSERFNHHQRQEKPGGLGGVDTAMRLVISLNNRDTFDNYMQVDALGVQNGEFLPHCSCEYRELVIATADIMMD